MTDTDTKPAAREFVHDLSEFLEQPHDLSNVKKVIGVMSGKGGVGKSLVTSMLAVKTRRKGYGTAILDADITGPSIPKMFGLHEKATGNDTSIFPVVTKTGVQVMSVNLLLDDEEEPVVWRGPAISSVVRQFWTDVIWTDVDYLFVDMPPGTGDVPLTVFQSLPLDGLIVVTTPQELVSLIVSKAVHMASDMNIPVLGIVENMSYALCPGCKEKIKLFGESCTRETAEKHGLSMLAQIPMEPNTARCCDLGKVEEIEGEWLEAAMSAIFEA